MPAPTNVDCSTATPLTVGAFPAFDNTAQFTWDVADPLFPIIGYGGGGPFWFKWTNPEAFIVTINATIFLVSGFTLGWNAAWFTGSCGSLTYVPSSGRSGQSPVGFLTVPGPDVAPGQTVYLEIDGKGGDTANPPTLSSGDRGVFNLSLSGTAYTYKDAVDGTAADDVADLDATYGAATNFNTIPLDYFRDQTTDESWELYADQHDEAYGSPPPYLSKIRLRYFDGATSSMLYVPLQGSDTYPEEWQGQSDFDNRQPEPAKGLEAFVESDGTNVWVGCFVTRVLTDPINGGTMKVNSVAVYLWNGSGLTFIDYIDGTVQNREAAKGQIPINFTNDRYTGRTGYLTATASSSMPGHVYVAWSEEGQNGKIGTTGDTNTYYWHNRIVLAKFSTSAKIVENDIFTDDTESWSATDDLPLPAMDDISTIAWRDTWHTNRATSTGVDFEHTTGMYDFFVNYLESPLDGFATMAYARGMYHIVNDDGVLQFFLVPPIAGDQPNGTEPAPKIECYTVNTSTLAVTLVQTIDNANDSNVYAGTWINDFRLEPHVHTDPLTSLVIRYVTISWQGRPAPQVIAIPSNLSNAAYVFDNNEPLSWLGTNQNPPRKMNKQMSTDALNQPWFSSDAGIEWFDRKCALAWLVMPARKLDGTLGSGAKQSFGILGSAKWDFDVDDIRSSSTTPHPGDFSSSRILRTHIHIGRDNVICGTIPYVVTATQSRIWFYKGGTWHNVGDPSNTDELWLYRNGAWVMAKTLDVNTVHSYLGGTWEEAVV